MEISAEGQVSPSASWSNTSHDAPEELGLSLAGLWPCLLMNQKL